MLPNNVTSFPNHNERKCSVSKLALFTISMIDRHVNDFSDNFRADLSILTFFRIVRFEVYEDGDMTFYRFSRDSAQCFIVSIVINIEIMHSA